MAGPNLVQGMDKERLEQLNLSVLQRIDPETEQVLASAGHVALYDFDQQTTSWNRKDVEGTLFVTKRRTAPRFQYIILNKKSQDHYVEDVLSGFHFEKMDPYILYRNARQQVIGIWFYDKEECLKVNDLLQRITSAYGTLGSAQTPIASLAAPELGSITKPAGDEFFDQAAQVRHAPAENVLNRDGSRGVGMPPSFQQEPVSIGAHLSYFGVAEGTQARANESAEPNRLEELFARVRVAPLSEAGPSPPAPSPAAGPVASPLPAPQPPALLTPSFFQRQTAARPSASQMAQGEALSPTTAPSPFGSDIMPQAAAQAPGTTAASGDLARLFGARLPLRTSPSSTPSPASPMDPTRPSPTQVGSTRGRVGVTLRERVKSAMLALAQSETFIDLVVQHLRESGL